MRGLTLGQFVERASPVHRLDPRIKLLGLLLIMALTFQLQRAASFAILLAAILVGAALSRVGLAFFLGGLRTIVWLLMFTAVFNLLFSSQGHPIWAWHALVVTDQGLVATGLIVIRIVTLVLATSLLTLTTPPLALTDGMERLGGPLTRVGFPVHEVALMIAIALRFIPTLMEGAERLMKAQMARGADVESRNPWRRVQALVPVLVPLFVGAFRAADDLADAMEARGYRGGPRQRAFRQLQWRGWDTVAGLGLLVSGGGLLALDHWLRSLA